ncbi:hypothetical protein BG004_007710 [Podila humilis]|nr:hypothetical protein BG004_007710 [Podila humilis]
MDVYSLTKKQRPTQLTRGEIDTKNTDMAQPQQHSQLPPQYRQALLVQQQQQKQQQQQLQQHQQQSSPQVDPTPPTLEEIESKHSQLPPQYRQAVLEQQQREHQMRLLQQQQQQQQPQGLQPSLPPQQQKQQQYSSLKMDSPRLQPSSLSSSPSGSGSTVRRTNSAHQRILSAPHTNSRLNRDHDGVNANEGPSRAHWKTIPLDHALDFNPAMGVSSRACIGCLEEYEQWQGLAPTSLTSSSSAFGSNSSSNNSNNPLARGTVGSVSESNLSGNYGTDSTKTGLGASPGAGAEGSARKNKGHIPEGLLGQNASNSLGETLGREDIVRMPKSASDTIAIKSRPVQEQSVLPMPSVPHDWSWSTF